MSDTVVYLGPSLALATARSLLEATYLPPIKRGDLALLPGEVRTVGIIDGVFHQSLAVSPKEIVELLDRGVCIYGASSIGALRAAETHIYGMVGIGRIFEMYRDREIDADDEVALAYDPESGRAVSEPLVNIRMTLEAAIARNIICREEGAAILASLQQVYYPLRTYQLVVSMAPALVPLLESCRVDQKGDDAIRLLQTMAGKEARNRPARRRTSASMP